MQLTDFDFTLPEALIALYPPDQRDGGRLLHIRAQKETLTDCNIVDLPDILQAGDVLVLNTTKVIPAALIGIRKRNSMQGEVHAKIEVNLLKNKGNGKWSAFARPLSRLKIGEHIEFSDEFCAELLNKKPTGEVEIKFYSNNENIDDGRFFELLNSVGKMPLPPYISHKRSISINDSDRYQTIFAENSGSVAAPTASLHFTDQLISRLISRQVTIENLTLHVGAGTFLPVKTENIVEHVMHAEWGSLSQATADALNAAKREGRRVIAAGTTALRLLESATDQNGTIHPFEGETSIFIRPGYKFRAVDVLLTNFHFPKSTLFMLVCAFGGYELMRRAYAHAIEHEYRFFSYGDACLIERAL